jgi:hypothetical protein
MRDADSSAGQGGQNEEWNFVWTNGPAGAITMYFSIIAAAFTATAIRRVSLPDCPAGHLHNGRAAAFISRALRGGLLRFYCCENSTGQIVMPFGKLPGVTVKVSRLFDDDPKFAVSQVYRHEGIRFPCKDFRLYESPLASRFEADALPDREPCSKTDDKQYDCDRYP